jgi:hypothetical protein
MQLTRYVALNIPEAKLYADFTGIKTDIREVQILCQRFLDRFFESTSQNWADLEVLCVAAIIRYGRTFPSGIRVGIDSEFIKLLDEEDQKAHVLFKALRDKWIAHSVNSFEENQLVVWLKPQVHQGSPVGGVSIQEVRVTSMGDVDMKRVSRLQN